MREGPGRYLDLAAECRELAESSLSDDARQRWLRLADTWLSVHDQVIALARLEKRDAQLSGEVAPRPRDKGDGEGRPGDKGDGEGRPGDKSDGEGRH